MFQESSKSSRIFSSRRPPLGGVLLSVGPELEGLEVHGLREFEGVPQQKASLGRLLLSVGPGLGGLDMLGELKELEGVPQQKAPFWEGASERWT